VDGLEVSTSSNGGQSVLTVNGEIDLTSAPKLDEEITTVVESSDQVVIELGGVSFMDSTGLRVLLKASKTLTSRGGTLVLRQPSEPVRRLLEVSGLNEHFAVS
jgi:anti-sigma B factor antagonist